ncbi:caspase-10 isoform X1 [Gopherus flavomarginatus]|uniref:caspase-10 isoform X1 n=1 Tax=Gopherus flavomarginatus TaxID=286002 RepID=UPI0021CBC9D9|nr:caspase-10 isoform X1 [Gopherus flavomarginatus]XP_050772595.1 caspase-10 isoform X1 [Gopherus flavomarginatus]XP_050772596.1 caspase-10 isoform X1 [Gopherus flavomarginatus]
MGDDIKFHQQLLVIDENLGTEEVEALKFLCSDLLSFKKLETVESAQDIFQLLMAKDLLNKEDTFILAELLYRIRCHFLLQKLGYTKETVQENLPWKGKVSRYRQMLYELSEDITSEDLKRAMFLLRDQLPKKLTNMSSLELLTCLEKQDHLAENNLEILEKICMDISPDLLKTVNKYKMERVSLAQQESSLPVKETASFSHHIPEGRFHSGGDVGLLTSSQETPIKSLGSNIYDSRSLWEHAGSVHFIAARQDDKAVNVMQGISELSQEQPATKSNPQSKTEKLMTYKMDGPHRGYCLIINNFSFTGTLQKRRGSNKDAEMLAQVFTWLGLDVKTYTDKTSVEIKNLMQEWQSSKDHRERDCFVCCILSHGELGLVYGIDEREVPIRTIMSYFTARQCPQLAEKPKLFFIQACQGKEIQQAVYIEADAQNPDLFPIQQLISPSESIPEEADFLLGMATVGGYASFRHIQHGTWYIQALCNKLQLLVPRGEDILSILTEVNEDVSKRADNLGKKKQMPQPAYTLRKKLIFPVPRSPPPSQQQ